MKTNILGADIDNTTVAEALLKVGAMLEDGGQHFIVTPNPEFLVQAQRDAEFREIINQADLSVPDGIGVMLAARWLGKPLGERITGTDLMEEICKKAALRNWRIFLLGGRDGVSQKAAQNLVQKYPGLKISAIDNQGICDLKVVASCIAASELGEPAILFVALGAPRQEKWIRHNLEKLSDVKLAMGVGGAFDFISGKLPRAPRLMRKIGLEWCWRFLCQPWRAGRIWRSVVGFSWLVVRGGRRL